MSNPVKRNPSEIIFPVLPKTSGIPTQFLEFRGYKLKLRGEHFVLPLNDSALKRGFPDTLDWHPRIEIDRSRDREIAEKMIQALPPDYEENSNNTQQRPRDPIKIISDFGLTAEVRTALIEVLFAKKEELKDAIVQHLLPLMNERFGMQYVFPVSIRAKQTQFTFSLARIMAQIEKHGIDFAKQHSGDQRSLDGLEMTGGLQVLAFLEGLTRLLPVSFSYPVNRFGCTWFFYKDGFDIAPSEAIDSTVGQFLSFDNPRNKHHSASGLQGATNCREPMIWQMHKAAIVGINRVMAYLSDLRTFMREDGSVDFVYQLKAFATLRLMLADLNSVNAVTNSYGRTSNALGFIDKLSNLVCGFAGITDNKFEVIVWQNLVSKDFGDFVISQLRKTFGLTFPIFIESIYPAIERCYRELDVDLAKGIAVPADREAKAKRLRTLRNLNHGAFLSREQFDALVYGGLSTVPESVVTLPFSLAWGFVASPEEFIARAAQGAKQS